MWNSAVDYPATNFFISVSWCIIFCGKINLASCNWTMENRPHFKGYHNYSVNFQEKLKIRRWKKDKREKGEIRMPNIPLCTSILFWQFWCTLERWEFSYTSYFLYSLLLSPLLLSHFLSHPHLLPYDCL